MGRRRRQYGIWEEIRRNAPKCTCQGKFNPSCPVMASMAEYGAKPHGIAQVNKVTLDSVAWHKNQYLPWCNENDAEPNPQIVLNVVTWGPRDLQYVPY